MVLIFAVTHGCFGATACTCKLLYAPFLSLGTSHSCMVGSVCIRITQNKSGLYRGEVNELASTVDLGTLLGIFVVVKPTLITMEDCSMSLISTSEIPFYLSNGYSNWIVICLFHGFQTLILFLVHTLHLPSHICM